MSEIINIVVEQNIENVRISAVESSDIVNVNVAEANEIVNIKIDLIGQKGDKGDSGLQIQSDWEQSDNTQVDYIKNKPTIPTTTSELTNDSGFITIEDVPVQVNSDWDSVSGVSEILNKPTIPDAQVNSDWNATTGVEEILNKPTIPTATSDLTNDSGFITIGDVPAQVNSDWNATSGVAEILNKPSIPAGQIQSDWTQASSSALDYIKNKPTIPAAQIQSDWNQADTGALDFIKNKPTIPSASGFVPYTGATTNVNLGTYNITTDNITLNTSPNGVGTVVGSTVWNNTIGSSETTLKGGSVVLKNGVDLVARIVNKVTPNATLTKATYPVVRVSGAQGQRLAVAYAQANNDNNSADTLGIVIETIATNQEGFIMTVGQIEEINTTGSLQGETWADGDVLYLSPTTAGAITNIKPNGSNGHIVVVGYVEYSHSQHGKIYVKIMNGWELDELHNVYINGVTDGQVLTYDSATSLWKNKQSNILELQVFS